MHQHGSMYAAYARAAGGGGMAPTAPFSQAPSMQMQGSWQHALSSPGAHSAASGLTQLLHRGQ